MRYFHLLSGLLLVGALCAPLAAEDVLVLNPSAPVEVLGDDQFKDVFLGKKTTWADGAKITVVVTRSGPGHEALMRRVGRTANQYLAGWKKLVFTGRAAMPEQVEDDARLLELVAATPGAIGLVDKSQVRPGMKVIALPQ